MTAEIILACITDLSIYYIQCPKLENKFNFFQLTIVSAGQGKRVVEFKVSENQLNRGGSLHGGFIAAVIDNVTTYALMANNSPPGVSVDLNVR